MSDTPIYEATWVDVTLASLFASLKAQVGLDQPTSRKPDCCTRERDNGRRLEILRESALVYAVSAA